jgi:AcrR family transcriptional regulator
MTRDYTMKRRAETAEETRQRIVRATYELHKEKGVGATSVRDIAERADVSPGTVYHHYPEYGDVIVACGRFSIGIMRPPSKEILDGLDTPLDKLRAVVKSIFAAYRRFPEYEKVRSERGSFAELEQAFTADEENRRELIREALRPARPGRRALAVGFALLDISVYHRLTGSGLSHSAAVSEVFELLSRRLLDQT